MIRDKIFFLILIVFKKIKIILLCKLILKILNKCVSWLPWISYTYKRLSTLADVAGSVLAADILPVTIIK